MKRLTGLCSLLVPALALSLPVAAADAEAGKNVYDQSCKACHGDSGEGSNIADSFYKTTIPRLASKNVQMKTNPELAKIIRGGTGKMEPVRLGRPTVPHSKTKKLTDQQVEDVIAYVRTFWEDEDK